MRGSRGISRNIYEIVGNFKYRTELPLGLVQYTHKIDCLGYERYILSIHETYIE